MTLGRGRPDVAMDRRAFLKGMPRELFGGLKRLMRGEVPAAVAGFWREPPTPRRAIAMMDIPRCLAWGGSPCQACYLRCPLRDEAMVLDDGRPLLMASACDGCGVCVEACRTVNDRGAIRMAAL